MIRCEHKRRVRRQLLAADDCQSVCDREVTSQQRKTSMMREALREVRFRVARCETVRSESGPCRGLAGGSRVPSDLPSAENLLLLPDTEPDKVIDVVEHGRRNKDQAIEPVENAAVPRNEFCGVLEAEVAFD